jgi:hypothetical protein
VHLLDVITEGLGVLAHEIAVPALPRSHTRVVTRGRQVLDDVGAVHHACGAEQCGGDRVYDVGVLGLGLGFFCWSYAGLGC